MPAANVPHIDDVDLTKHTFRGPEVCAITGISYRQLDYWCRTDLIRASIADARGSGTQRLFSRSDVALIRALVAIVGTPDNTAHNDRLTAARNAAPVIRAAIDGGHDDLLLVVTKRGHVQIVDDADQLLELVRLHQAAHVLVVPTTDLATNDTGTASDAVPGRIFTAV